MFTIQSFLRPMTVASIAMLFSLGAAQAAGPSQANADAQARYKREMAVCNSGQSSQSVQTCRTEARNALAEAKRGGLTSAPVQQYRNAVQRCADFIGDDRVACEDRVRNPTRVEGSVEGGGVLRESVILVPAK